jgi:anaphase-promoting complex subunit 2
MTTDAVPSQVAAKWQESFNRLNGNAPGISGLLSYSEVTFLYSNRLYLAQFLKVYKAWRIATVFVYPRVGSEAIRQGTSETNCSCFLFSSVIFV